MGDEIIPIIVAFSIPLLAIWTSHKRKMLELQLRLKGDNQKVDTGVRASVEALREEVRSIKDTTMQYDLSFDAALQRLEKRIEGIERNNNTNNSYSSRTSEIDNINVGR